MMSRLVRIPVESPSTGIIGLDEQLLGGLERDERAQTDGYLERIAKYIPGEVLAFFIVINAILNQVVQSGGKGALMAGIPVMTVAQVALVVCTILVPLFVWYVREKGDAWVINTIVSTLAFPFWAYALGATAFLDYWDGNLAAIMLATFTVVSGLIAPRRQKPTRRERDRPAMAPPRTDRPQLDLVGPGSA
jgi:uncharacterized membrane protein YqaE (UPF0057 family)